MSKIGRDGPRASITCAGQGRSCWVSGDRYSFIASTEQTDGRFALYEAMIPPGVIYGFRNDTVAAVRMLVVLVPSGLERFLADVGTPDAEGLKVSEPAAADIARMI